MEAIATRLEAIVARLEAIAIRLEAIHISNSNANVSSFDFKGFRVDMRFEASECDAGTAAAEEPWRAPQRSFLSYCSYVWPIAKPALSCNREMWEALP